MIGQKGQVEKVEIFLHGRCTKKYILSYFRYYYYYIILSAETSLLQTRTRLSLFLFLFALLLYYIRVNRDFRIEVVSEKPENRIFCGCYYCFRTAILDGRWPMTCRETHTTYIILKIIPQR